MESDELDWNICSNCCALYRFGSETTVYMFADRPDFDYIFTVCPVPKCRAPQVILGVQHELYDSLHPSVKLVRHPVATDYHRARALSGLQVGDDGTDSFRRDLLLEMHTESVRSLFPKSEKNEGL